MAVVGGNAETKAQYGKLRFAVDTGGTFTDLVVADASGGLTLHKVPTTPADPVAGVLAALGAAAAATGQRLSDYLSRGTVLVHGTTHAINAIVTGNTAKTAFLTTQGHPDTLVFREGGRQDAFNFTIPYPAPFIPKALTFEVPERIGADGGVRLALDEAHVTATLDRIRQIGAEAVAVCLLWSIVNPAHELRVAELLDRHLPGVPYTLSHQINPSIREYRRAMSTCLDACLKPAMAAYMGGLTERLEAAGFAGRLLIVTSQGGVMDAADVARAPVHLINSGPSMAPVGARAYARLDGCTTLIVGDTGGTTFDVSLVHDGRIPRTRETWLGRPLSSHMTGMPSVDTKSIGAGGGSIAWVDSGGLLHVGPQSAGSVPGPAAYRRGGRRATVTDAAVVLGYIDPLHFLGGQMVLDRGAATEAIRADVASPLGQSVEAAAAAVLAVATEHMVQAIMDITVNQGIDTGSAAFVAGGGAAGLNCVAIGRRLGCRAVLVPEPGAALAAAGALVSDLAAHYQAMFHTRSDAFDRAGANAVLEQLEARCRRFRDSAGPQAEFVGIDWSTEARYPDQAWEIVVPLRTGRFAGPAEVEALVAQFHRTHQDVFATCDTASPIETVGWSATVHCRIGSTAPGRLAPAAGLDPLPSRQVYFAETGWTTAVVSRFNAIGETSEIAGPAVIESHFTSIVLDPGATARRDPAGTIVIGLGEQRDA